jgi:hypothetical protein
MIKEADRPDAGVQTSDTVVDIAGTAGQTRSIMTSRVTYLFAYFADTEMVEAVGS